MAGEPAHGSEAVEARGLTGSYLRLKPHPRGGASLCKRKTSFPPPFAMARRDFLQYNAAHYIRDGLCHDPEAKIFLSV